jgi:hypothetical protein
MPEHPYAPTPPPAAVTPRDLIAPLSRVAPAVVKNLVAAYADFSHMVDAADAKAFAAHHTACKAALGHLETLMKVVKMAEEPVEKRSKNQAQTAAFEAERIHLAQIEAMIRTAQAQINGD